MTWAASGVKITQPVRLKISFLEDPEIVRRRILLLVAAIEFIRIRHLLNLQWKSSSDAVWNAHINFILGPKVRER